MWLRLLKDAWTKTIHSSLYICLHNEILRRLTPQPSRCEAIVLTTTQPCQFVQNVKLGVEQSLKCTSSKTPWAVTGLLGLLPPTRSCFISCSQLCINMCIFFTLLQNYARSFLQTSARTSAWKQTQGETRSKVFFNWWWNSPALKSAYN